MRMLLIYREAPFRRGAHLQGVCVKKFLISLHIPWHFLPICKKISIKSAKQWLELIRFGLLSIDNFLRVSPCAGAGLCSNPPRLKSSEMIYPVKCLYDNTISLSPDNYEEFSCYEYIDSP